ncbi:cytochrome-c peroxidase [Acidisoma sp. C75]
MTVRILTRLLLLGAVAGALGIAAVLAYAAESPVPLGTWLSHPVASFKIAEGENPSPVQLAEPQAAPLSALAEIGRRIFYDPRYSASGTLSCASCHDPARAYGPPSDLPAVFGGPDLKRQGMRAVPSLAYLAHQPPFTIGPDPSGDSDTPTPLPQLAAQASADSRAIKTAASTAQSAANVVPQGGLFWDGRANTLQDQALGPLLNPVEMDGGSIETVAAKLRAAPYAKGFVQLFGPSVLSEPRLLVSEALFAVARYQVEDPSFHPYSSKYDAWLAGRARFTRAEMRGYIAFNDPAKGDCAACHLDQPSKDGLPPLFTDHQFEALGLPRNRALLANRDPNYYDLGICGPFRSDLAKETQYCGMFLTPTLRNVATRHVFFHNGVYHSLQQVLDFYDFRDTDPAKIYPRGADGRIAKFNDLPPRYRANIDVTDPPFNRHLGDRPAMTAQDERDIIAFLKTLTDGYRPPTAAQ